MKRGNFIVLMIFLVLLLIVAIPIAAAPLNGSTKSIISNNIEPLSAAAWTPGPIAPDGFGYTRFDGVFVPGGGEWGNKVYFLGGRSGASTEDPSIWIFDPVAGTYTDSGMDVVEDVSNYTANLITDDGTGRGPAIYIIGGYDADGAAGNIGTIQRYYPQINLVEALPSADDWTVTVAGNLVGAMGTAVVNDVIYVFGGWENILAPYFYAGTWVFDPAQPSGSRWTDLSADLNPGRAYIQVALQSGIIYAMGGIYQYTGGDLVPTTVVQAFDTANPGAGWVTLAPMPVASGEGRGFGFDADTLSINQPWDGKAYVVGGGDWSDQSAEVMEYDINSNSWDQAFPDLITARRDHAGVFVPLCTPDPNDGLPGMWVFGGRAGSDDPPYGPTEFYPMECAATCSVLVVDDDWDFDTVVPNDGGRPYYTSALDALGYAYDVWDSVTQGDPVYSDLAPYDTVIWFTGYDWETPFTADNEAEVATYLDDGGSFMLSSQEYYYAFGLTPFLQNYLGVDNVIEDVVELDPVGVAGNPIGDGLGPYTMVRPDDWAAYWPTGGYEGPYDDVANPIIGAESPFKYNASDQNNSTNLNGGTFKTVYMAFPFEWIDTVEERTEIMAPVLDYLCAPVAGDFYLTPPSQSATGIAGQTITYTLSIINSLGYDDSFDLAYDSLWLTQGPATIDVPSGETVDFEVTVAVPEGANCYEKDSAMVTATSLANPSDSKNAALNSSVIPPGTGSLEGFVYDANTNLGIENGHLAIYLGNIWLEAYADADGAYSIPDVGACLYDGDANAYGYFDQYGLQIEIAVGDPTSFDVYLDASWPNLLGNPISVVVPPDTSDTYKIILSNDGSGDLFFHITEVPSGAYELPLYTDPSMPSGVDPLVYQEINASPDGTTKFIVYMRQQADLSAANGMDWSERGQYVLDTLRSVANQTQAGLITDLNKRGVSYESRYIVNAIVLSGNRNLVDFLAVHPDVGFIGPNLAIPAPAPVVIDPQLTAPAAIEWNIQKVHANQVWSTYDVIGEGIVLSNMDTGVQWDHPALINQYRGWDGMTANHNYNWWDPYNQNPSEPTDADAHGTHTMGTMLGSDNPSDPLNATNAIGMAPGAKWMACDGFDNNTGYGYDAELLECAEFLLAPWDLTGNNPDPDMRPDIINNSWGGGQAQWWYNQAIYAWRAAGIMGVFSIGNSGPECSTAGSPGDGANMIGVGATDSNDLIAGFSGRGPAVITNLTKPDVSAPGANIRSSVPGSTYQGGWGGTSMAAPHVSGAVALIWSAVPELRGDVQITSWILEQSAFGLVTGQGCGGDLPDEIPNNTYGWGRIDAFDAVSMALGTDWDITWLTVDPAGGTVAPSSWMGITLTFDTTGLTLDQCYVSDLLFEYNDPYVTQDVVPVELCVGYPNIFLPLMIK